MVAFYGDYDTTETVIIPFNTFSSDDPSASVTITNLVTADVEIHKDGSVTQRASDNGVTVTIDFDSVTGNHIVSIDLSDNSDAGFYANGSRYQVRMEGTTIDGATINAWIGSFSIGCTLRPTTAGRTLDVTATNKVQGVVLADTVTTLTGHTAQTGDSFARLGTPAGASIAADLLVIDNFVDALESRLTAARAGYLDELAAANIPADVDTLLARLTAVRAGYLDNLSAGAVALASGVDVTKIGGSAQSATDLKDFVDAGYDPVTNKVQGVVLVDTTTTNTDMAGTNNAALASVCTEARLSELDAGTGGKMANQVDIIQTDTTTDIPAAIADAPTKAELDTAESNIITQVNANETKIDTVDTVVDAIRAVADNVPNSGAMTDIDTGVNNLESRVPDTISIANINAEVDTALLDIDLDHLIQVDAGVEEPINGSYLDQIMHKNVGQTFDAAIDSLEAIRDRGDAAWTTGGGASITDIVQVIPSVPSIIDIGNTKTWRLALYLINSLDNLPTTVEIDPGTIDIDRSADGGASWISVVSGAACSELAGIIYYDEVFDSGTGYVDGDAIRITFKSQKITVAANDYEISGANGMMFYAYVLGGGDASATNQTTIIGHLTDVKGTGFVKDTDSLVDLVHQLDDIDGESVLTALKAILNFCFGNQVRSGDTITIKEQDGVTTEATKQVSGTTITNVMV